jgi:hypothetical protein
VQSRLLLAVVALWLGMLAASWIAATLSFRTVDHVLGVRQRPELEQRLSGVSAAERRGVLRHLASEINRSAFGYWAVAQLVLGAAALALGWRLGGATRLLVAAAVVLAAGQTWGLTGPITELGRAIDFVPRPLPEATARRFGMLHGAYVGADLMKAAMLSAAVWTLCRRG